MKCIFFVLIFFLFRDFLLILPRRGYLPGSTFSYLMEEVVMQQSPDESNTIKGILSL